MEGEGGEGPGSRDTGTEGRELHTACQPHLSHLTHGTVFTALFPFRTYFMGYITTVRPSLPRSQEIRTQSLKAVTLNAVARYMMPQYPAQTRTPQSLITLEQNSQAVTMPVFYYFSNIQKTCLLHESAFVQ